MGMWEGLWGYSDSVHWWGRGGKGVGRVESGERRGGVRSGALGLIMALGSGPIRQARGRLDAGMTGMCSVGGVNVFSFGGDVFSF